MQEWIIAMLVISVMLILRDMAKTFLKEKKPMAEIAAALCENHPQKEKIERYADAFQKLADTFYGMPYRKEFFSKGQIQWILEEVNVRVCGNCYQREICWHEYETNLISLGEVMIRAIEEGDEECFYSVKDEWKGICTKYSQYIELLKEEVQKEKQNLFWNNRMIENRLAVAQQLTEVSGILRLVATDLYDISEGTREFRDEVRHQLRKKHILVKDIWVMDKMEGRRQIFLNICTKNGRCISVLEAAQVLSEICKCSMSAIRGSRSIINGEYHRIQFMEDVSYQMVYGVSQLTSEDEKVSGDNYVCRQEDEGRFVMCLSDGMGSGMEACKESEMVVELLEQFLDSGFSQETAARMVNSVLLQSGREGFFSTLDIGAVDLYTGICSFLKAGAAATFIKRDHWVEVISSESLAAGLMQQMEFEKTAKKLYHGDYIIMMSDGVLDVLPRGKEEEIMKEIILGIQERTPKDISRGILERVLGYSDYRAKDDMTVLVGGIWKK